MGAAGSIVLGRRYSLGEKIGAGGFSEVWRATDLVLARPVAIKLLYLGSEEAFTRFRGEAQHAGRLSHENVARIYDYSEPAPPQPPFLVMELVDGPSLAGALAAGPLDPPRALRIVAQIASGLHAAHLAGLVHRDIKPANLLLADDEVVKITDFGIARAMGSAPVTVTGQLLGTPGYLAPERVMGASATSASDLYSLGIVAYECLAGAPPFTGPALAVAMAHRERPLPPLPGQVPGEVAGLISELTAKDPANRPCSAGEVAWRAGQMAARQAIGVNGRPAFPYRSPAVSVTGQVTRSPVAASGGAIAMPARSAAVLPPGQGLAAQAEAPAADSVTHNLRPPVVPLKYRARRALRQAALPAAAAIVVVVAAFLTASAIVPGPAANTGAVPSSTPSGPIASGPARAATVDVRAGPLIGLPVPAAMHLLHQQGLVVHIVWLRSNAQPPGTVLSVQPAGWRRVGSTVILTGALSPAGRGPQGGGGQHGHGHHHGHGHRRGRGHAHGNGHAHGVGHGHGSLLGSGRRAGPRDGGYRPGGAGHHGGGGHRLGHGGE